MFSGIMSPGPEKKFDRDEVLEKAMQLFWEQGYEPTGITQILERVGIGRQSLYNTFGDKRALFLETLGHYFRTRVGPLLAQLQAPGSPLENIREVFRMAEKQLKQTEFHGCMIGNATAELPHNDPEVKERVRSYLQLMEDAFADTLKRAQEQGEISSGLDARDLARVFVHTLQGLILLNKVLRDPKVVESVLRSSMGLLQAV
jgi:TetR/AcrR family transcriptional repressor of nem operon